MLLFLKPYDGRIVFKEIKKNTNDRLTELFYDYSKLIVNLIVNLQVVLDVEKVLIGGGISEQSILLEEINRQYKWIKENSYFYGEIIESLLINTYAYKNDSSILGTVFDDIQKKGK